MYSESGHYTDQRETRLFGTNDEGYFQHLKDMIPNKRILYERIRPEGLRDVVIHAKLR